MVHCRVCKKEGHTRRTCPATKEKTSALELDLETGEMALFDMVLPTSLPAEEIEVIHRGKRDVATILEKFDLDALIERYKKTCSDCGGITLRPKGEQCADCYFKTCTECSRCAGEVGYIYWWKGACMCGPCYITEKEALSEQIQSYLTSRGMTACAFCKKSRTRVNGFHLDHLNMFTKKDSLMHMLQRGEEFETIREEIDKCQLLCIDCHQLVTGAEIACGFHSAKMRKVDEAELYADVMSVVYERIRAART